MIIVDDGSTDGSAETVKDFLDSLNSTNNSILKNIRLISQKNAGVSAARNHGITEARGEYVALLDADDEWKPDYLATIIDLIHKYPQCEVFATNYEFRNSDGKITHTQLNKVNFKWQQGILDNYFEVGSCSNPPICSICIVAKKNAFETIGGFAVGVIQGEDLLTWAKLASRFKIAYSLKPLAIFNIGEAMGRNSKPKRNPPENDVVGQQLLDLKNEFNPPYIKLYLSFWHKMRSVLFWRCGKRGMARKEAMKALRYNPLNYKAYALLILNLLPIKR